MFTGIIEDIGAVKSIEKRGAFGRINVKTGIDLSSLKTGDSVAIDGVCLTIISASTDSFSADLSDETLRVSTLGNLRNGDNVNIESAITLSRPLGGHFVTGHIDGIGTIREKVRKGDYLDLEFGAPARLMAQVIKKGSIAVDGISLTVVEVLPDGFRVSLIPHTLEKTTLLSKVQGAKVNIETDIIGKYVERVLSARGKGLNEDFLAEHGFLGKKKI